jgi:hypothetical protein
MESACGYIRHESRVGRRQAERSYGSPTTFSVRSEVTGTTGCELAPTAL